MNMDFAFTKINLLIFLRIRKLIQYVKDRQNIFILEGDQTKVIFGDLSFK